MPRRVNLDTLAREILSDNRLRRIVASFVQRPHVRLSNGPRRQATFDFDLSREATLRKDRLVSYFNTKLYTQSAKQNIYPWIMDSILC